MNQNTYEWHSFLTVADEWLINYSLPTDGFLPSVKLFSIGHALELYLKATISKTTGNVNRAIGYGHDLKKMWDDRKKENENFMPDYEIKESILECENLFTSGGNLYKELSKDDFEHFLKNQELYVVTKLLSDLKYLGTYMKSKDLREKGYALGAIVPNPYWIKLFRELRNYLNYPQSNRLDIIKYLIDEGGLPKQSRDYLKGLYLES